jgi:hypothetical protein
MALPVRQGVRRHRSVARISRNRLFSMRGLAALDNGSTLAVGRANVCQHADRCWRKLVIHAVLTVRCANVAKLNAETMRRTVESRGGRVPPRLWRRHAASAALCGPSHRLHDENGGLPSSLCRHDDLALVPCPSVRPICGKPR